MAAMGTTLACVSCAGSGDIHVLRLEPLTGALSTVQVLALGGRLMPMAQSPNQRCLYVARRSDPLSVITLSIDLASGWLAPVGEAPLPHSMAYIATDRSGRWLFSASYGGDQIAVSPIGENGVVAGAAVQVLATEPHAHAIQADGLNRHVLATSLGGDRVMQMRFDAATGQLTPNDPPAWPARPGSGPRHFVFHPKGRVVYLLGELDGTIDVLAYDADNGLLSPLQTVSLLPPGFEGKPWASDLHLTPGAQWLVASERTSSTLASFHVDPMTGQLGPAGHSPTEAQPRGFAIEPGGRVLLAAGEASHRVASHAVEARSGALPVVGGIDVGQEPNWIEFLQLP
jgi:6-phosphogluconolactonase